jgi:hypothetical protein
LQSVASEPTGIIVVEFDPKCFGDIVPAAMTAAVFALKPMGAPKSEESGSLPSRHNKAVPTGLGQARFKFIKIFVVKSVSK